MGVLADPALEERLAALHAESEAQAATFGDFFRTRVRQESDEGEAAEIRAYLADKLVALDKDKAEFCHLLVRAMGSRRVVEVGTSFGVSTVYLAAAVRANVERLGGEGSVIATEYEAGKAAHARALFAETGLATWIDLREGDLRETLRDIAFPVEFVLMDIWTPMVVPALERLTHYLVPGAVIVADNTYEVRVEYGPFFDFIKAAGFRTVTLPFAGGLEMAVKI
jgi:predicted O-methyltransferase YrrM